MSSKILNTDSLPEEVYLFKKVNDNNVDPIKKEIYTFSEISFIMNYAEAFPVNAYHYYSLKYDYENNSTLLTFLALSYLTYKTKDTNNEKLNINNNDINYIKKFIVKFYQYNNPFSTKSNKNTVWLYPKIEIKKYLSNCIKNNSLSYYYFDEITLTKFIIIITKFVNYEYKNADKEIMKLIETLNFPTLVLANINLYEKGILKFLYKNNNIEVALDLNGIKKQEKIFTNDINTLKRKILSVLFFIEGKSYSMGDFID